MAITKFEGQYACFSNYYMCNMVFEELPYRCSESCYQSLKYAKQKSRNIYRTMAPSTAHLRGQKIKPLRPKWDEVKDDLMYKVVFEKFYQNKNIQEILLSTGDEEIINENDYHDNYWGICSCEKCRAENIEGQNKLGKILMKVREDIPIRLQRDEEKRISHEIRFARWNEEMNEKERINISLENYSQLNNNNNNDDKAKNYSKESKYFFEV